jgi:hypothetical protein
MTPAAPRLRQSQSWTPIYGQARVIPWDTLWGVHIKYSDRKHSSYPVGNQGDAERELNRITGGSLFKA